MRLPGLVLTAVLLAISGILVGSVIGLLLLLSLIPCVQGLLLPDQCMTRQVLIVVYTYAPLIVFFYILAVISISLIKRKKVFLVLLALAPGIYVALALPVEIARYVVPY